MNYRNAQQALSFILWPLSRAYAAILRRRAVAYANNPAKRARPKGYCISVGNIACGGSGKTPLVSWLLDWAAEHGHSATVLTRGYGGKSTRRPLLVTPDSNPAESGDEPLLLALSHTEARILADPRRRRALGWAEEHSPSDVYLLDDGMQHLDIWRDLNLVLLRAADLSTEWDLVIPAGLWREDASALERADAFLLRTSVTEPTALKELEKSARARLERFNKPVFCFDLYPRSLAPLLAWLSGDLQQAASLPQSYNLCTAVGTPASVISGARQLIGQAAEKEFIFPDHYAYRAKDLKDMERAALPLVVTGKDAVKMLDLYKLTPRLDILVLHSDLEFGPALFTTESFPDWLAGRASV